MTSHHLRTAVNAQKRHVRCYDAAAAHSARVNIHHTTARCANCSTRTVEKKRAHACAMYTTQSKSFVFIETNCWVTLAHSPPINTITITYVRRHVRRERRVTRSFLPPHTLVQTPTNDVNRTRRLVHTFMCDRQAHSTHCDYDDCRLTSSRPCAHVQQARLMSLHLMSMSIHTSIKLKNAGTLG